VDYKIYLDPKNDYKIKQDEQKIALVIEQNNVDVRIVSKKDLELCNIDIKKWLNIVD
jgi:hypothetical protein